MSTSSNALCATSTTIPNLSAIKPSLYFLKSGNKLFASLKVSKYVLFNSYPNCEALYFKNPISKSALCATKIESPTNSNILGNTLSEIAVQNAGIIKENSNTIFISQDDEVNKVIENTCKAKNNTLHLIKEQDISNYSYDENYQKFDYRNYKNVIVNIKGKKQIYNASICLECMQILKDKGYTISENSIRRGLSTSIHKARFEKLNENPTIIYDGAHNKPAMQNLINSVNMYYKNNKKVFIVSILKTKDYKGMLGELLQDKKATYIFTSGNSKERYVQGEVLANTAKEIMKEANIQVKNLKDSIYYSVKNYKDSTIFIVGSFYVYGDVINILKEIE